MVRGEFRIFAILLGHFDLPIFSFGSKVENIVASPSESIHLVMHGIGYESRNATAFKFR